MFPHDAGAFFKPDVFPPATAEMVRKDVNGLGIFLMQECVHTSARRLDAPGKIVDASPFLAQETMPVDPPGRLQPPGKRRVRKTDKPFESLLAVSRYRDQIDPACLLRINVDLPAESFILPGLLEIAQICGCQLVFVGKGNDGVMAGWDDLHHEFAFVRGEARSN